MLKKTIVLFLICVYVVTFMGCNDKKADRDVSSKTSVNLNKKVTNVDESTQQNNVQTKQIQEQKSGAEGKDNLTKLSANSNTSKNNSNTKNNKQNQAKQKTTSKTKSKYSDWVPYSTSNLKTLADNISKGYVVRYNGQYLASPDFVKMIESEETVYINDVAPKKEEANEGNLLQPNSEVITESEE